jgi:hypothetical protein
LQLIENLGEGVRVGLSLHERAEALKRLVAKFGDQSTVAAELGITQAWVSYNLAVIDLSPPVEALREKGIVKDCKVLTGLEKLNKAQPEAAAALIEQAEAEGKFPKAALKAALADAGLVKPRKGSAALDAPDLAPKIEKAARRAGVSPEPGALFRFLLEKYLDETEGEA